MRTFWIWFPVMGCEIVVADSADTGSEDSGGEDPVVGDDDVDDTDDDTEQPPGPFTCTRGSLFAGDPLFADPQLRPDEGAGLLDGPPLPGRTLVFAGDLLVTHTGRELWLTDLSVAAPVLDRFSGREEGEPQMLRTGACEQARFANLFGMALAPDGTMFLSDQTANAILEVTDPLGPNCTVHHFAGSHEDYEILSPSTVPNQGAEDGPGARASFRGVERIAVSDAGEVFVWDAGNASIRKIAADATVSTLVTGIDGNVQGLVWFAGKLYLWGNGNDLYLTEVDPADGATRDILHGRGEVFGGDSSESLYVGGIVADGEQLVVYFNGRLYRVSLDGEITALAGDGTYFEFDIGYDPYVDHPADELQLASRTQVGTAGANLWMGIDAERAVYVNSRLTSSYIEKVSCGE